MKDTLYLRRKVDVRLPEKGNSNSRGARPVHLIITMIKWNRTSRLPITNSLSCTCGRAAAGELQILNTEPTPRTLYLEGGGALNGSSQGQSLALTGLFVPSSLDSG